MLFSSSPLLFLDLKVFLPPIPQRSLSLGEGYGIDIPFATEFFIVLSHSVHSVQLWFLSALVITCDTVKIDQVRK